MPSVDKSPDGEDPLEPPSHITPPAPHSAAFSRMSMHVYAFPNALLPAQQPLRPKRRQVKNACTHCQKACKKCDDARPCLRCVKYGYSEECVDSQRKERKKGVKRGPYKKRDGKGSNGDLSDVPPHCMTVPNSVPVNPGPYMPLGYPGFYGQYPTMVSKPGEAPTLYPTPFYLAPAGPPHVNVIPEGESQPYATHGQFYQVAGLSPMQYSGEYSIARPDGPNVPHQYPVYPGPAYPKLSSEMVNGSNGKLGEQGGIIKAD